MAAGKGTSVELTLSASQIATVVGGYSREAVERAAEVFIQKVFLGIVKIGRVQTGKMAANWDTTHSGTALEPIATVRSRMPYTIFQERGTRGSVAAPGKVLRFQAGGKIVFAKRTGPIPAGNFMKNAIEGLKTSDFLP